MSTATLYLPPESILSASFSRDTEILSTVESPNGINISLALDPLSYIRQTPSTLLVFEGVVMVLGDHLRMIQVSGLLEYRSDPSNRHAYEAAISYPEVLIRNARLNFTLVSTSFRFTEDPQVVAEERAIWRIRVDRIFGLLANMTLSVEVEEENLLNMTDYEIDYAG